ncbi:InlB B-repeat-containing protein [Lachnospiraceae bacterium 54-53]
MDETGTGSILRFDGIRLSGEEVSGHNYPLILADRGTIQLNKDAVLEKNIVASSDPDSAVGSAAHITGSANLTLDGAEVTLNQSGLRGAIYFDSTGEFQVLNEVTIKDNVNAEGKKANVYLAGEKYITVEGDLGASRVGVTSERIPEACVGESTEAGQEVVIAVPSADYSGSLSSCPFADNFFADADTGNGTGIYATVGSTALNNSRNTVLKRNGYAVSFVYRDTSTGGTVTGAPDTPGLSFASGDEVIIPPPSDISGYELTGVSIDQGTGTALTAVEAEGDTFGKITGVMPGQDVVVTYEYTRMDASIAFVVNGGTPQPEILTGTAGNSVNALLPNVSRYGYIFKGWSKVNSQTGPEYISSLPAVYPEEPVAYYAIWEADPEVKFNYTVDYTNQSGSIVFQSTTMEKACSVETEIRSHKKNIHGYLWSLSDSLTSPAEYDYHGLGAVPIGSFDGQTGEFTGRMPGQDTAVRYAYKADRSNTSARSDLTVRCVTENGTVIHEPVAAPYYPEEAI